MARVNSLSTEYIRYELTTYLDGQLHDPTGDTVAFAVTALGATPTVWVQGSWEILTNPTAYVARLLVGPAGDVTPAKGDWTVWVKVTDAPETPVKAADTLTIY